MMDNRMQGYRSRGKKEAAYKFDSKRESLCEDALEILQEILYADATMQMWFDRPLDFGHRSLIDASLGNLPRLVTSRSIDKQGSASRLMTKREVKISIVEQAIRALLVSKLEYTEERQQRHKRQLDAFLKLPSDELI